MSHATVLLLMLLLQAARPDADDDTDAVPFLIFIEHSNGYRCAASLVSQRTVVTSARCALGEGSRGDVVARASGAARGSAVRRVGRRALAGGGGALAVLELERPFAPAAEVRPILIAVEAAECRRTTACHAVRVLPGRQRRLRVVDMTRAPPAVCVARFSSWASYADAQFCLSGDDLCEQDLGGGVVCGGRLCGVLNDVAAYGGSGDGGSKGCGNVYVAQNIVYWRRFLHCAHTLRQCGRGSCEELCVEEQLLKEEPETSATAVTRTVPRALISDVTITTISAETTTDTETDTAAAEETLTLPSRTSYPSTTRPRRLPEVLPTPSRRTSGAVRTALPHFSAEPQRAPSRFSEEPQRMTTRFSTKHQRTPSRSSMEPRRAPPHSNTIPTHTPLTSASTPPTPLATDELPPSARRAPEFEPNRADFRAGVTRTSRVPLKAGEYGDNAVDYGAEEALPPASSPPPPPAPRTPPRAPAPSPPDMPALRLPPATPTTAAADTRQFFTYFKAFVLLLHILLF